MAYRFHPDEPVRDAVVRCAAEQLDAAAGELRDHVRDDPVEAVHAARKAIKKERSLLRLARSSLSPGVRRQENDALRHAARSLGGARDAEATLQTLDALARRYAGQLPEHTFDAVRHRLAGTRDAQRISLLGSAIADRAAGELGLVRDRVTGWELREGGWAALEDGLTRSYAAGRAAVARARASRSLEEWHTWRKRVKDLWYQERLLGRICGPAAAGHAKDLHQLADLLGDEHDLGVLCRTLRRDETDVADDLEPLLRLIAHRRAELRGQALLLGRRVYAESPKAYTRRMRRSFRAGRELARTGGDRDPVALARATHVPSA
jgi:CHAD domain-containing protein